jgi:CTP:molybdopterin cytidylyltransferase MocA
MRGGRIVAERNGSRPREPERQQGAIPGPGARAEGACWVVLLAAGEGRRFGGRKLLEPLSGRPLLQHALGAIDLAQMEGILAGGVAVVPEGDLELRELVEKVDLLVVENPEPEAGLSRSLVLGIEALESPALEPRPAAAVIVLGDQPMLRARVIGELIAARGANGARFVRPRYADGRDQPGHPVVVERSAWPLVRRLAGDAGLGPLLAENPAWVTVVDVTGSNPDVNSRSDLEDLERRL